MGPILMASLEDLVNNTGGRGGSGGSGSGATAQKFSPTGEHEGAGVI